jgi:signal transduction histidine kinase
VTTAQDQHVQERTGPPAEASAADLGSIIEAYYRATERLERSHQRLTDEVERLRGQLQEKNRELAQKERLASLGEMAAGVAHEVRNPLGAIRLYASVLDRDLASRPESQRLVEKIACAVNSLENLVCDILAFAGHGQGESHAVTLSNVLDEVLALAAPQRDALGAAVHVDNRLRETTIHGEDRGLTRALLNLLFNALDAAGEDGRVWISSAPVEGGYVGISVADDGPGVAPDLAGRIFDPFFTTKHTGTGLGLSIVHRIAEAHGGRVEVKGREGGGAVFTLVLPRADAIELPPATSGPRVDLAPVGGGRKRREKP